MTVKPTHPWNGTEDGHGCVSCPPDSIWRCDVFAHFHDLYSVLDEPTREKLLADLRAAQKIRRMADTSKALP